MSHTTIYTVPKSGSVIPAAEYNNAFGGAWFVWNVMYEAYEKRPDEYMHQDAVMKRIWALFKADRIEFFERAVMGSTFDRVMVRREHWPRLAECMEQFYAKHYDTTKGTVCSIRAQATTLKKLFDEAPEEIIAVCWCQTSVNGDAWYKYGDGIGEDGEDERGYDITKDDGHWFLFDELTDDARTTTAAQSPESGDDDLEIPK